MLKNNFKVFMAKEIIPKIKPQDFKSFTPEHKGPLETKTLSDRDFEITKVVFDYVDKKQWRLALSDAQKTQDKTIYTLVYWMFLIEPQNYFQILTFPPKEKLFFTVLSP